MQSPATDITVEESELGSTSDSITASQSSALSILSKLWHLVQQRSCGSAKYKGAMLLSLHTGARKKPVGVSNPKGVNVA